MNLSQDESIYLDNANLPLEAMGLLSYLLYKAENNLVKNPSDLLKSSAKNTDKQINNALEILLNYEYVYWYKIINTETREILETGLMVFEKQTMYSQAMIFAKKTILCNNPPLTSPPGVLLLPSPSPSRGREGVIKTIPVVGIIISSYLQTDTGSDKTEFIAKCIHRWNSSKNTRKHKIDETSGVYKRISKYINQLITGKFFEANSLDIAFHKGIPETWLTKKWTSDEILRGIRRLSLLMVDGYEFRGKATTNSLDKLLYNPGTNKSWFLHVMQYPPRQMKDLQKVDHKYPVIVDLLKSTLDHSTAMDISIEKIANDLVEWHEVNKQSRIFLYHYPTAKKFVADYIEWLKEQDWIETVTIYHAQVSSKTFVKFIEMRKADIEF